MASASRAALQSHTFGAGAAHSINRLTTMPCSVSASAMSTQRNTRDVLGRDCPAAV